MPKWDQRRWKRVVAAAAAAAVLGESRDLTLSAWELSPGRHVGGRGLKLLGTLDALETLRQRL
jgi:hypothetical protein